MSGTEQMEWYQAHGNYVFVVFDTIPLSRLMSLPRAHPPQLWCHQPPVVTNTIENILQEIVIITNDFSFHSVSLSLHFTSNGKT